MHTQTQRDYGRRDDRKQARLKYLVQEWGIDKFRWVQGQALFVENVRPEAACFGQRPSSRCPAPQPATHPRTTRHPRPSPTSGRSLSSTWARRSRLSSRCRSGSSRTTSGGTSRCVRVGGWGGLHLSPRPIPRLCALLCAHVPRLTLLASFSSPAPSQGDGKLFVGVYVQNGRLKGEPKKALRAIIESYGIPVRSSHCELCHANNTLHCGV